MLRLLLTVFLILIWGLFTLSPTTVFACHDPANQIPHNAQLTPMPELGVCPAGVPELQAVLERVISLSVGIAFIALVAVLTWGGIKYLTSGGEPKALPAASLTITWALLGIIFLVLAWLILRLIEAFTGVRVTQFCIGFRPFCL